MNRRTTIKTFLTLSVGVTLLPRCMDDKSKAPILLKNIRIEGNQEKALEELADTILPATDTPGARSLSSHLYALMMVDECYEKNAREKFTKGLQEFDDLCKKRYGNTFEKMQPVDRNTLLTEIENKKDIKDEVSSFYRSYKRLIIQHYSTSPFFLKNVQVYELAPARYHGCVPYSKTLS